MSRASPVLTPEVCLGAQGVSGGGVEIQDACSVWELDGMVSSGVRAKLFGSRWSEVSARLASVEGRGPVPSCAVGVHHNLQATHYGDTCPAFTLRRSASPSAPPHMFLHFPAPLFLWPPQIGQNRVKILQCISRGGVHCTCIFEECWNAPYATYGASAAVVANRSGVRVASSQHQDLSWTSWPHLCRAAWAGCLYAGTVTQKCPNNFACPSRVVHKDDISRPVLSRWTAMHSAAYGPARHGRVQVVAQLLEAGANIDEVEKVTMHGGGLTGTVL
jgi:hypothetical protein